VDEIGKVPGKSRPIKVLISRAAPAGVENGEYIAAITAMARLGVTGQRSKEV
jgi:hypothetical protein